MSYNKNAALELTNIKSPSAVPIEEAILGSCMMDRECIALVISILPVEAFYLDSHKFIFESIIDLFSQSLPVDLLTVTKTLQSSGKLESIGGPVYIVELTNKVSSSANIEYHCRIVKQEWIKRHTMVVGHGLYTQAQDPTTDPFDLVEYAEKGIFELSQGFNKREPVKLSLALSKEVRRQEEISGQPDGIIGLSTGFRDLDKVLRGLRAPDLMILAARPGMGKTALMLALSKFIAENGNPAAVFSLEMSVEQLTQRIIAMDTELPGYKIENPHRRSEHENQVYFDSVQRLENLPLFIDDEPGINITQLRSKCRRLKQEHDIGFIVVDYLQLMSGTNSGGSGRNREQEISEISRGLKMLAKELHMPVLALSQLSRAVEQRGGTKRPQLSDLRESGSIEQDADIVSFIYRPEYYKIMEDADGTSTRGLAEIIIAKNRRGAVTDVDLHFRAECTKFTDRDSVDFIFDELAQTAVDYQKMANVSPPDDDEENLPF